MLELVTIRYIITYLLTEPKSHELEVHPVIFALLRHIFSVDAWAIHFLWKWNCSSINWKNMLEHCKNYGMSLKLSQNVRIDIMYIVDFQWGHIKKLWGSPPQSFWEASIEFFFIRDGTHPNRLQSCFLRLIKILSRFKSKTTKIFGPFSKIRDFGLGIQN